MKKKDFCEKYAEALKTEDATTAVTVRERMIAASKIALDHDDHTFRWKSKDVKGLMSLIIAMEECSELQKELSKIARGKTTDEFDILQEMADVYIMIERIKLVLGISDKEFNAALKVKTDVLVKRMEDEEDAREIIKSIIVSNSR